MDSKEYRNQQKQIRIQIRNDLINHNTHFTQEALERNSSRRVLKQEPSEGKKHIFKVLNKDGEVVTDKEQVYNSTGIL